MQTCSVTLAQTQTCLSFSPNLHPSTRRGVYHLQCQKSHPKAPITTPPWPETARWRAPRSSGKRRGSAWWPPRELHQFGKTRRQRAPTALRSTFPKLRQGYENTGRNTQRCDVKQTQKHTWHWKHKNRRLFAPRDSSAVTNVWIFHMMRLWFFFPARLASVVFRVIIQTNSICISIGHQQSCALMYTVHANTKATPVTGRQHQVSDSSCSEE